MQTLSGITTTSSKTFMSPPRFAVIGGLGAVAGADILHRVVRSTPVRSEMDHLDINFVQCPFQEILTPDHLDYNQHGASFTSMMF